MAALMALVASAGCGPTMLSEPQPDPELVAKIRAEASGAASAGTQEAEGGSQFGDEWGNLKGRFVYTGNPPTPTALNINKDQEVCGRHNLVNEGLVVSSDGGLANVVVFLITKKVPVHADFEATAGDQVTFDNEHCRFEPHILPLRLTQTLVLHNSDPVGHNSKFEPLGDTPANPILGPKASFKYRFAKVQNAPVTIACSIHPWMKGYVLPRDNPYVAVSKPDGTFLLKNLPAGNLEFQVWQETAGALAAKADWKKGRFKFKIEAGDNDLGEIQVDAGLFAKQ